MTTANWWESQPTPEQFAQRRPPSLPGAAAPGNWWDQMPTPGEFAKGQAAETAIETAVEAAPQSWGQKLRSTVTGNGRREEGIGELPENLALDGKATRATWLQTFVAENPDSAQNVVSRVMPGATFRKDQWGNPIIKLPGNYQTLNTPTDGKSGVQVPVALGKETEFYLNKPGFSGQDVANLVTDTALVGGGALVGGAGGARAGGLIGKAIGAGLGAGAGSLAMDATGAAAGSKAPLDYEKAATLGLVASGAEAALPIGVGLWRILKGSGDLFDQTTGTLTQKGADLLRQQGLDPDAVNQQFAEHFAEQAAKGADPAQAASFADARALPTPIDLTKGDLSRDVTQQGFEDAALKGAYGDKAKDILTGRRSVQQDQLRENVDQIATQLGGGQRLAPGEGATRAMQAVQGEAKDLKRAVDGAYDSARGIGTAAFDRDHVAAVTNDLSDTLAKDFDLVSTPGAARLLTEMQELATKQGTPDINDWERWRTRLVTAGKAPDAREQAVVTTIKKRYDEMLNDAIDYGLMSGDPATVAQWKQARSLRAEYGNKFEANEIIKTMVRKEVEPDQAVNYLFGAGRLGFAKQSAEAVQKLKGIVGPDSQAWKDLKQEAFLRLVRGTDGPLDKGLEPVFSGTRFASNFDEAMERAPTLMKELFDPKELALIGQFRRASLYATNRVPGAVNHSGSGLMLARLVQDMFGSGSTILRTLYGRTVQPLVGQGKALDAMTGAPQRIPVLRPGVAAGAGGVTYSQQRGK